MEAYHTRHNLLSSQPLNLSLIITMQTKEEEAKSAAREAEEEHDRGLPVYSPVPTEGPTADSPFDFPTNEPPPAFISSISSTPQAGRSQLNRPIAIPQIAPNKTEPFLNSYAQLLLEYGITPESWRAFLSTMSAFLAAKVSEQAIAHAADMGRHVTNVPKRFGKETIGLAKEIGGGIRDSAREGNYLGAAAGTVIGAIRLPVGTALRAAGAAISLPFAAIGAVTHRPQTPRERAAAYAAAANKKWLSQRGLQVKLVDTVELAGILGLSATRLLDIAESGIDRSATGQIEALREYICGLETFEGSRLQLGSNTLWLLIDREDSTAVVGT
jgi:hypothetical protein